jgi:RimJ/RimL family protein N-acetyltransferase
MELIETGELVGDVGLQVNKEHQRAEAGYIVGKKFWGKGYAPEGLRAVLDFGFRDLGLYRIDAHAMPWNDASERVMQKVGMQREGVLRGQYLKWGRHEDALVYATIRPDWEASQQSQSA